MPENLTIGTQVNSQSLLTLIMQSAVIASLVSAINAYIFHGFKSKLDEQADRIRANLSREGFVGQEVYKREYEIYRTLWPIISTLRYRVQSGEFHVNDKVIPPSKAKTEKIADELFKDLGDALQQVSDNRPFLPTLFTEKFEEFAKLTQTMHTSWLYPTLNDSKKFTNTSNPRRVSILAVEIESLIRHRMLEIG